MTTDNSIGRLLIPLCPGPDGVAHALGGIGRTKLYELIDSGDLVKVKIGRRAFVTAASVAAYVDTLSAPCGRDEGTGAA